MLRGGDYDTPSGVEKHLTGLEGLRELIELRREAVKPAKDYPILTDIIVLGRFLLSQDGNVYRCTFSGDRISAEVWRSLPPVITLADVQRVLTDVSVEMVGGNLPTSAHVCGVCGGGWDLSNCEDVYRAAPTALATIIDPVLASVASSELLHAGCFVLARELRETRWHAAMAREAGLGEMPLTRCPNEYWNDPNAAPWCLIRTPRGTIKFGWRKNVINIEWACLYEHWIATERARSATESGLPCRRWSRDDYKLEKAVRAALDPEQLFAGDTSTKGKFFIHAWSQARLVEVLRKLSEVMRIGAFKGPAPRIAMSDADV